MASFSDVQHMIGLGLESNINNFDMEGLFYYQRGLSSLKSGHPVLLLIHGYPQTNFMWRHLIPLLPTNIPLFIPDIPGYGRSPPLSVPHNKTNQAHALLTTLLSKLPSSTTPHPIVLCGHDRGARICHRAATKAHPGFTVQSTVLLDIVPTLTHYQSFSHPAKSVDSFHWPFLANVEIAVPMLMAQGGDVFTRTCLQRWVGKEPAARAKVEENDAVAVYGEFMKKESVVRATCDDYRAGGQEDIEEQINDQREERKLDCDVLVVYSSDYLGKRYDMKQVWLDWVSGKGTLETLGIEGGIGHFVAEEAPVETARAITGFFNNHL